MSALETMGRDAKAASRLLAITPTAAKNAALLSIADGLEACAAPILAANAADLEAARQKGTAASLLDRLSLQDGRLASVAADVRKVAALPDPVGEVFDARTLPNGIRLHRRRVPLGVIGVIYEARPNVTVDIAALAIKTGNAAILRGGSETLGTNRAIVAAIRSALEDCGRPANAIQLIDSPDRARITDLLRLDKYVSMIIPRGGAGLHRFCVENATVPVIVGGIGVCHLYADKSCDRERALAVIENAKVSRPSVCNSLDTLLVHSAIAPEFLPAVVDRLSAKGVSFQAEPRALALLPGRTDITPAGPDDFDTEWMGLTLGLKVVDGLDDAIAHIQAHGDHSDGILTADPDHAARFLNEVDSAAVFVNASTRFNDGGQFGLGAEVAVSTQKLHARGPMGLAELTSYKWVAEGDYHTRG